MQDQPRWDMQTSEQPHQADLPLVPAHLDGGGLMHRLYTLRTYTPATAGRS
jgi:hypothetical protein